MLQKAKKNNIDMISRKPSALKPINLRKKFRSPNDNEGDDDQETDEIADLEERIR